MTDLIDEILDRIDTTGYPDMRDYSLSQAKAQLTEVIADIERLSRIDEVMKAKNRKQIFGYYDERLAELTGVVELSTEGETHE